MRGQSEWRGRPELSWAAAALAEVFEEAGDRETAASFRARVAAS